LISIYTKSFHFVKRIVQETWIVKI
jgi:hypothetical protein